MRKRWECCGGLMPVLYLLLGLMLFIPAGGKAGGAGGEAGQEVLPPAVTEPAAPSASPSADEQPTEAPVQYAEAGGLGFAYTTKFTIYILIAVWYYQHLRHERHVRYEQAKRLHACRSRVAAIEKCLRQREG